MADETRAVIFGRDALTYEGFRPGYPRPAIDHVTDLVDADVALEVGAGTGKATESFAKESLRLICLEPSPQMAEVLRGKDLPGVEVVTTTFEDWDGPAGVIDLIFAAQSWHWVDRETGLAKALRLLRPGGVLALLWNLPIDRYGPHEEIYARHAPHLLAEHDERVQRRDHHEWDRDMAEAGFAHTAHFTHEWSIEITAAAYRALYSTYSDHMLLNEPQRTRLLDALESAINTSGGAAKVQYRTRIYTGRKPDTDPR